MSDASSNVSGRWIGIYSYAEIDETNRFSARLRDVAGAISGETSEQSTLPRSLGVEFPAMLEGVRSGTSVSFRKYYDNLALARDVVHYFGSVASDGNEITGHWQIPGQWSGDFIMIRSTPLETLVEERVAEPVS